MGVWLMAQVIFRTVDNTQADVVKNRQMYKSGDVVTIVEDSHQWGEAESKLVWVANGNDAALWPGGFFILRVIDATVAELMYLLEEAGDIIPDNGLDPSDPEYIPPTLDRKNANYKRRKHWTDYQSMYDAQNKPTQRDLDRDAEYTVTIGAVNNYFKVKA